MSKEDIANIEPIAADEFLAVLDALGIMDLIDEGELAGRWTVAKGGRS